MTVIIFLIVLAVLIFVHELGHFLAARIFGIRVDAFKIGFGPKIFAWKRGETEYGLNAIPFGGFVKIFGEDPDADNIGGPDAARSFVNKPRWQQAIVLASGLFFNFLFAWLLYAIVFSTGVTVSTAGFEQYTDTFRNERIMISYVGADSPAAKAGLKEGDSLVYVETTAMNYARVPHVKQTVEDIQNVVNDYGGKPIALEYEREGHDNVIAVTPIPGIVEGKHAIGIGMDNVADVRLPIFSAVKEGLHYTIVLIRETFYGVYDLVAKVFKGTPDFSQVAGPVGIAGIVGNAARMGFSYLMMITAIISINLGVLNLVPFPALDGGRILFVLIESVIRRRIPHKFTNIVNTIGFGLLIILMIVVTWKDIVGLFK